MYYGEHTNGVYYGYHEYDGFIEWKLRTTTPRVKSPQLGIGIELESEHYGATSGADKADLAYDVTNAMGHPCIEDKNAMFVASRDGSLENGIEFISQPCTYQYHITKIDWEKGLKTIDELGARCHDGGHCGLHYHLSRSYFENNSEGAEELFTILLQNNKDWLRVFSRRESWQYCEFASLGEEGIVPKSQTQFWAYKLKGEEEPFERFRIDYLKRCNSGHGSAINFAGNATIELRFIRATTNYTTFLASLQLVVMMAEIVKNFSCEQVCSVRFSYFLQLAKAKNFKEFLAYTECKDITPERYGY